MVHVSHLGRADSIPNPVLAFLIFQVSEKFGQKKSMKKKSMNPPLSLKDEELYSGHCSFHDRFLQIIVDFISIAYSGPVGSIIYADLYGSIKIKFTVLIRDTDQ